MSPCRLFVLFALLLLSACGARTTLSTGEEPAAGPRDAGPPDAGAPVRRDAGPRDDAGPLGDSCERDRDCDGALRCRAEPSFPPADLRPMPLVCGALTDGLEDGSQCHDRDECDRGLCVLAGTCVAPCRSDRDCASGERCGEMYVVTSGSAMQSVRGCAAVVSAPSGVRVAGPEPGPRLDGDDPLPGLSPFSLVIWTATSSELLLVESLRTRSAPRRVVFDAFAGGFPDDPPPDWAVAVTTVAPMVTLLYPNGPNTPSSPAGFDAHLSADAGGESERYLAQREGPGSRFDIDAYLVGGGRWSSPDGAPPDELARLVTDLRAMLSGIDLELNDVRVHEVVGTLRTRYAVLEGEDGILGNPSELPELYRLSAGARLPSVNVFFVRTMDMALGIASGIPGPHVLHGTGASGVAIAVDLIPEDQLAEVVLHEVGHFMGLFHTSEYDGAVNDPFPDTEACRGSRDENGDGYLAPEECTGFGEDLLMFWTGDGVRISDQQAELMRRAFFVR